MEEKQSDISTSIDYSDKKVLVTGVTGYLAGHCLKKLLEKGFQVRGTVRSTKDTKKNEHLFKLHPSGEQNLELVEADLSQADGWVNAMEGIDYVLHIASPFPQSVPKDEMQVIGPAVNGTSFVFQAAIKAGVKKIVITSSIAAIFTGVKQKNHFNDKDWSNVNNSPVYQKSKHLAEQQAWEIFQKNKDQIKMTIINPAFIQGPTFSGCNQFTSAEMVTKILKNDVAGIPKVSFAIVDVRQVAEAHVRCIENEYLDSTNAKRYILSQHSYWMEDIVQIMREEFQQYGYKLPSMNIGTTIFTIASWFDDQVKLLKPFLNRMITFDNTLSALELKIHYRNVRETLIEMAYDLIDKGQIPDKTKGKRPPKNQ